MPRTSPPDQSLSAPTASSRKKHTPENTPIPMLSAIASPFAIKIHNPNYHIPKPKIEPKPSHKTRIPSRESIICAPLPKKTTTGKPSKRSETETKAAEETTITHKDKECIRLPMWTMTIRRKDTRWKTSKNASSKP